MKVKIFRESKEVMCAFGTPWLAHFEPPFGTGKGCVACHLHETDLHVQFLKAVEESKMDAQGYTPQERRAQKRGAGIQTR